MATVAVEAAPKRRSPATSGLLGTLGHNRNLPIGLAILVAIVLVGMLAPWLSPHDPLEQDLLARLLPPAWDEGGNAQYVLGSDNLGRDVLSRLIYGSRISLLVGFGVVLLAGSIGVLLGLAAGYRGGWTDTVIMRLADAQQALPGILLAIIITAVFGARLVNLVVVLSIASWPVFARIVYSATRSLKEREFVHAALVIGAGEGSIIIRHILPNVAATCLVVGALQMGRTILAEASLSFLGLGVPPPAPSWGGMVSDGLSLLQIAPWTVVAPGIAIAVTVWGVNLLGDGLRQALDPRLRHLRSDT